MTAAASSVFLRRERVVEVSEAQAAAVAKAICEPSEFHHAVYPLLSPSHIAIYDVNAMWSHSTVFTHSIPMCAYP